MSIRLAAVLLSTAAEMESKAFEDLPEQIEFHQRLRDQLEKGRKLLTEALSRAAKIPAPGQLSRLTEEDRIQQIEEKLSREERLKGERGEETGVPRVRLQESRTLCLFQLEPRVFLAESSEGQRVAAVNQARTKAEEERPDRDHYRDGFTQTMSKHYYQELFQTDPIMKEDKDSSASNWMLYDAFKEREEGEQTKISESKGGQSEENKMKVQLLKAVQTTCRALASNFYAKEQMIFCKKHETGKDISYKLTHLWTLTPPASIGPVNKICLNPHNSKVVGAGYGDREGPGKILVWNVKNPSSPERELTTEHAVTCLQFSVSQPRLLAAVTRAGAVLLLDIASHQPILTKVNLEEEPPFPEPLWSVCWFTYCDGLGESERLLTIGQSGQLWMWDPIQGKEGRVLAELNFIACPDPELKIRSQEVLGSLLKEEILEESSVEATRERSSRKSGDEHFLQVPYIGLHLETSTLDRAAVYVTTDVGVIIKVNSSRSGEGLCWNKLPQSHKVAVLGLRHSPFQPKIFLTHSYDGTLVIWIAGFEKPLLRLATTDLTLFGVESADWSPSHSTILASLTQEEVCLWDISRRTDRPITRIPGTRFTTLAFSQQGTNLLIGDKNGEILVYRLSELPHRPYMQKEHLEKALTKELENKPDLLKGFNAYLKSKTIF